MPSSPHRAEPLAGNGQGQTEEGRGALFSVDFPHPRFPDPFLPSSHPGRGLIRPCLPLSCGRCSPFVPVLVCLCTCLVSVPPALGKEATLKFHQRSPQERRQTDTQVAKSAGRDAPWPQMSLGGICCLHGQLIDPFLIIIPHSSQNE